MESNALHQALPSIASPIGYREQGLVLKHKLKPAYRLWIKQSEFDCFSRISAYFGTKWLIASIKPNFLNSDCLIVYWSLDAQIVKELSLLEEFNHSRTSSPKNNDQQIGALLGYPECCINYYVDFDKGYFLSTQGSSWLLLSSRISRESNFILPLAMNIFSSPFRNFIEYIPCSLCCRNSINFSNQCLKLVSEKNKPFLRLYLKSFTFEMGLEKEKDSALQLWKPIHWKLPLLGEQYWPQTNTNVEKTLKFE